MLEMETLYGEMPYFIYAKTEMVLPVPTKAFLQTWAYFFHPLGAPTHPTLSLTQTLSPKDIARNECNEAKSYDINLL